jgi:triphosphoribosyl-dephospho-CoA synthase
LISSVDMVDAAACCQLALLLELSTTPKPGLVDRVSRVSEFPQFLATSTVLHRYFMRAALSRGKGLGKLAAEACADMLSWQRGGNTHLGSILLLMPLAAAIPKIESVSDIRPVLHDVLAGMNHRDALEIFKAVKMVAPGGLGRVAYLDVNDEKTYARISKGRITVVEALRPYRDLDIVAHEYATDYEASYKHGYMYLRSQVKKGRETNEAGVNTFLNILANIPDTHVARRHGRPAARLLSKMAGKVLAAGGASTPEGHALLEKLCLQVRRAGYRPAATADLLATAFCILLIDGWRP